MGPIGGDLSSDTTLEARITVFAWGSEEVNFSGSKVSLTNLACTKDATKVTALKGHQSTVGQGNVFVVSKGLTVKVAANIQERNSIEKYRMRDCGLLESNRPAIACCKLFE